MDTHTAVAAYVTKALKEAGKLENKCVIASTASPYKFVKSVMTAIDEKYASVDDFELMDVLRQTSGVEMPQAIKDILNAKVLHTLECDADKMEETVKGILAL